MRDFAEAASAGLLASPVGRDVPERAGHFTVNISGAQAQIAQGGGIKPRKGAALAGKGAHTQQGLDTKAGQGWRVQRGAIKSVEQSHGIVPS